MTQPLPPAYTVRVADLPCVPPHHPLVCCDRSSILVYMVDVTFSDPLTQGEKEVSFFACFFLVWSLFTGVPHNRVWFARNVEKIAAHYRCCSDSFHVGF